ncbi:MAG: C39 family peptidase [Fibrobacteres bacterium]|nr:C39 family peptidase [Fibrobacterota bacterium]
MQIISTIKQKVKAIEKELETLKEEGVREYLVNKTGIEVYPQYVPKGDGNNDFILDIAGYSQTRTYTCGPTAVFTVLKYLKGDKITIDKLLKVIKYNEPDGCSQTEMLRVLKHYGISVKIKHNMPFRDIVASIKAGKPIIATTNHDEHWITIVGVTLKPKMVYYSGAVGSPKAAHQSWREFRKNGGINGDSFVCSLKSDKTIAQPVQHQHPCSDDHKAQSNPS